MVILYKPTILSFIFANIKCSSFHLPVMFSLFRATRTHLWLSFHPWSPSERSAPITSASCTCSPCTRSLQDLQECSAHFLYSPLQPLPPPPSSPFLPHWSLQRGMMGLSWRREDRASFHTLSIACRARRLSRTVGVTPSWWKARGWARHFAYRTSLESSPVLCSVCVKWDLANREPLEWILSKKTNNIWRWQWQTIQVPLNPLIETYKICNSKLEPSAFMVRTGEASTHSFRFGFQNVLGMSVITT